MSRIAVVYLARLAEGFAAIEAFAKSYKRHAAGQPHDLVLVCKGFSKRGDVAAVNALFRDIPHEILCVDDEIGFDIHAYKIAASQLDHDYFCFLNTHTQLQADNWLQKLFANLCRPDVGLVGATGSYESLYSSYKVITRVSWCCASGAMFDRDILTRFAWIFNGGIPGHKAGFTQSFYRRLRRSIGNYVHWRPTMAKLGEQFDSIWCSTISPPSALSELRNFPRFPNQHIRTNVFMLRRDDFLAVPLADQTSKMACSAFESGYQGLSRSILHKGQKLVVVGADGQGYDVEQWPASGGFRSGDQSNLLASDNQTRSFEAMFPAEKATHAAMTWGGYEPGAAADLKLFDVDFSTERPLAWGPAPQPRVHRERLFSIAIPTHNRLELLLDAIKTVTRQNYDHWEIVVFDNASTEPIGDALRELDDPRIRWHRSDEFLPVTESWNRALDLAEGDYVTLIGDDDGLAPGFFERINQLADEFDDPDAVFSSLYQFIHPGVSPHQRAGFVADLRMASFFGDRDDPFVIDKATARGAVDGSLGMRRSFMFNMPAFTVGRDFLDSLRRDGKVLHSPFPDYYFANLVLEKADTIVGEPRPLAFQGVSRASFGYTLINGVAEEGFKVLGHESAQDELFAPFSRHMLPGPRYNSQYMLTMAYLAREIGDPARQPDFGRYRKVQILHFLRSTGSLLRWPFRSEGRALWQLLTREEKLWALRVNILHKLSVRRPRVFGRHFHKVEKAVSPYAFQPAQIIYNSGDFVAGSEVFEALEQGTLIEGKKRPPGRAEAESARTSSAPGRERPAPTEQRQPLASLSAGAR